jgi:hypothetical protein
MNDRIQRAVEAMVKAIEDGARERAAYLADPHERQADRDEFLKMIDRRRDDIVKGAKVALDTEFSRIASTYQRTRKSSTSYDEAEVAAAGVRVKGFLDTFRGVPEIVEREGFDRNEAEWLRRNLAAYEATRFPGARPVDIERRVRPQMYDILRAELRLMDRDEAQATEDELGRVATDGVVKAVDKMAITAAQSGRIPAQDLLAVGFAGSAAGFEPSRQTWRDILAQVDPDAAAVADRNALPPATRTDMDRQARQVEVRDGAPIELTAADVGRLRRR